MKWNDFNTLEKEFKDYGDKLKSEIENMRGVELSSSYVDMIISNYDKSIKNRSCRLLLRSIAVMYSTIMSEKGYEYMREKDLCDEYGNSYVVVKWLKSKQLYPANPLSFGIMRNGALFRVTDENEDYASIYK